jgi:hypothetical protein
VLENESMTLLQYGSTASSIDSLNPSLHKKGRLDSRTERGLCVGAQLEVVTEGDQTPHTTMAPKPADVDSARSHLVLAVAQTPRGWL